MDKQQDIEIYVKGASVPKVEEWLKKKFGTPLVRAQSQLTDMIHFTGQCRGQRLIVTVIEGYEFPPNEGIYTSVYFVSSEVPWQSDVECAREAISFFESDIICDATALGHSGPDQ